MALTDWHDLALFDEWHPEEIAVIVDAVTAERRVAEGEVLCREDEAADVWWIVAEGQADITIAGIYVGTVGPGETLGELALLDGEPRGGTVTARTDMLLHEVSGDSFERVMRDAPGFARSIARQLAGRLRDANGRAAVAISTLPDTAPLSIAPAEPVAFNPFAPGYFDDPTVQLGAIREQEAVHFADAMGAYIVTRYEDVYRLSRDKSVGIEIGAAHSTPPIEAERAQIAQDPTLAMSMLRRDGDDHTRLRRLVSKAFTPRAIERWRMRAISVTEDLIDGIHDAGGGDVIADLALPLPVQMISEMLGMPTEDADQLKTWSAALAKTLDPLISDEERAAGTAAAGEMAEYIRGVYDRKKADPTDDILSALIAAEEDGDRLSRDEVMSNVRLLYVAGHETTTNLIGNGLLALLRNPDQLDRVRTEPGLDANLVEEVLRYDSPVQFTRRIPTADIEVGGTTIAAGSVVLLCAAAANRDPRKWGATHDDFLVARAGANEQLSFGGGRHFCLGAALARLEGQIALPRLVRRFPNLAMVSDTPDHMPRMVLRGLASLHVTTG